MHHPLILYIALFGALLALAVMAPAVRGAAVLAPGADAVAVAKKSSGGGKLDNAKDHDATRAIHLRRAVGVDEKKAFAKYGDAVRDDRIKPGSITGSINADE